MRSRQLADRPASALRCAAAFVIVLFVAGAAGARPAYDKRAIGPEIGERLPMALVALDASGKRRDLASLSGRRGLVLLFSRSLDWCVYCKAEAVAWNDRRDAFRALGYRVAVITYDPVEALARFAAARGIRYTLLSDKGSQLIKAYGLLNRRHRPGSYAHGIPHPIVFVIGPDGRVRHRFSEASYAQRPDIDLVLKVLRDGGTTH